MKEKVILICYSLDNFESPRGLKWSRIANKLKNKYDLIEIKEKFSNIKSNSRPKSFFTYFKFLRFFRWPDYATLWLLKQLPKIFTISKPKKIISVSHPFSSHIIGLLLKIKFRDVKWIIDIGDPFGIEVKIPANSWIFSPLNKFIERIALRKANIINVNSKELKKSYIRTYQIPENKINVVNPIYDNNSKKYFNFTGGFKMIYGGRFYKNERPISNIIEFADFLRNKEIKFSIDIFGDINAENKKELTNQRLSSFIRIHESLAYDELQKEYSNYDFIINMSNKSDYQVPSKIPELLAQHKPIINITQNNNDYFSKASKNFDHILNFRIEGNNELIVKKFMLLKDKSIRDQRKIDLKIQNELKSFSVDYQIKYYE